MSRYVTAQVFTVRGYVENALSGERIPGASLDLPDLKSGVISNQYGFYRLTVGSPTLQFEVSHVAYDPVSFDLALSSDTTLLIVMAPRIVGLEEVAVVADGASPLESIQMGVHDVEIETIQSLPVLLREVDIQKTLRLLPGVQSGNEGTAGLLVRGGRGDQNLILIDAPPPYNTPPPPVWVHQCFQRRGHEASRVY